MARGPCGLNETLVLSTGAGFTAVNCTDCEIGRGLTANCALFDFVLYTVVGGTLCAFGLVGNVLSFIVLHFGGDQSSKSAATIFLVQVGRHHLPGRSRPPSSSWSMSAATIFLVQAGRHHLPGPRRPPPSSCCARSPSPTRSSC